MNSTLVRPLFRLVASGITGNKKDKKLRLCLAATPVPASGDGSFELRDWPQAMAVRMATGIGKDAEKFHFMFRAAPKLVQKIDGEEWDMARPDPGSIKLAIPAAYGARPFGDNPASNSVLQQVKAMWVETFTNLAGDDSWPALASIIEASVKGKRMMPALQPDSKVSKLEGIGVLPNVPSDPKTGYTVKSIIPARQADLAFQLELTRAERVAAKLKHQIQHRPEEFPVVDLVPPEEKSAALQTTGANEAATFDEAVKMAKQAEMEELILSTGTSRSAAANTFKNERDRLEKGKAGPNQAQPPTQSLAKPEPAVGNAAAKSQLYARWPQASGGTIGGLDRIAQVYHTLQGDPGLSRLFGFMFDLEVDPAQLSGFDYLFLAALVGEQIDGLPPIWTAAKRTEDHFWPVPKGEIDLPPKSEVGGLQEHTIQNVILGLDQFDGIVLAGGGAGKDGSQNNPRFGLVSLDMRRAAELVGEQRLPNAGNGQNAFHTAGLVVIDRGRAKSAQMQAARTAHVNEEIAKRATPGVLPEGLRDVILYAEDLTIGQRLDVATVVNGAETWRSLMNRTVDYDFRLDKKPLPKVKAVLDKLLGASGTGNRIELDATTIVFASRLLPSNTQPVDTSTEQVVEAVVDEVVAQWDGTPMSVHCGPKPKPVKISGASPLPFRRTLGLPDGKSARELKTPRLRYGKGYRATMRSTFLGGRSVPLTSDGSHLQRTYQGAIDLNMSPFLAFPARFDETLSPASQRRFLRQNPIAAPFVLLPGHIALRNNRPMGFETAGRAILREDVSPPSSEPVFPGPDYIPSKWRASTTPTMRIVVPPAVALDEAVRHGMLDGPDFATRLQGGLLDVRYDRLVPDEQATAQGIGAAAYASGSNQKPAGFPIAVTRTAEGDSGIEAELSREIAYAGEARGEAAFVPGADKNRRQPYYPDPAADVYLLRLRDRATGTYLNGGITLPIYEGGRTWPNVTPLAITIRKAKVRPSPTRVSEVLRQDKPGIQYLGSSGLAPLGARVQAVVMELAPGEDYMLEAVCLPVCETLAGKFTLPETLGALAMHHVKASGDAALQNVFGPDVAAQLLVCKPESADPSVCHCATGGHAGADDIMLSAIAARLIEHITATGPVEDMAAVTEVRAACVTSRPLSPPATAPWPIAGFEKAAERVAWLSASKPDAKALETLFGPVSVMRPAPLAKEAKLDRTAAVIIGASDLAREVQAAATQDKSNDHLLFGTLALDLTDADGFDIVAETVSPHSPTFDDDKRGRSLKARRSGRWPGITESNGTCTPSPVDAVLGFEGIDAENRVTLKRATVTLLTCQGLPKDVGDNLWPRIGGISYVSLAMVHQAARHGRIAVTRSGSGQEDGDIKVRRMFKAEQTHVFSDAKARKLRIKAVARSRFASDWETAERWQDTSAGDGMKLARRQPLNRSQQTHESGAVDVWMPASKRPAKCQAKTPLPVFHTDRVAVQRDGEVIQVLVRRAATRIYLDRGWFSSGEGERLGLVIWPPNSFDHRGATLNEVLTAHEGRPVKMKELMDEYAGPAGPFITRWGGDPIRWDNGIESEPLIDAANFADVAHLLGGTTDVIPEIAEARGQRRSPHDPRIVKRVAMPIQVTADDAKPGASGKQAMVRVSLITYEPCFDADREEWYVDIEITPSNSSDPFVRFGLVRYQEHAPPHLQVSEPVTAWAQLMPRRTVHVRSAETDEGKITVEADVFGKSGTKVKLPGFSTPPSDGVAAALDRPHMRMIVAHESERNGTLHRVGILPMDRNIKDPNGHLAIDGRPNFENGDAHWRMKLEFSGESLAALGPGSFYAYLEEYERRMPASYAEEPLKPQKMLEIETFAESGPRFSARVPIALFEAEQDRGSK